MQTRGEHANSTQKRPDSDWNPGPFCCEATVLTTTPLCRQILFILPKITINPLSHWALTHCTDVKRSAPRSLNWLRKKLNSEIKKPEEEPQKRDPSSEDGQTCNKCHLYRTQKHSNNSSFRMYKTSVESLSPGKYSDPEAGVIYWSKSHWDLWILIFTWK